MCFFLYGIGMFHGQLYGANGTAVMAFDYLGTFMWILPLDKTNGNRQALWLPIILTCG